MSKRIAEREAKKITTTNSKNKVAFLALKSDIQDALSVGWSKKVIWETLFEEGKISFSYKTFRTYVSQFILLTECSEKSVHSNSEIKMPKDGDDKESKPIKGIPAFTFRPTPNPEELL
ncbi:MAG: TraK family protein [Legionella sp.]|uniref:TraK family protein n=1 Tax=Legionella sp. TaxID=459 RepID=UPI0039E5F641